MSNHSPVFIVLVRANSGSGTLTFPEDFEFLGVFDEFHAAERCADAHNRAELKRLKRLKRLDFDDLTPEDVDDMGDDQVEDALYESTDAMIASVVGQIEFNPSR